MIDIRNLHIEVGGREIISDLSISFELGKNYCLLGKNASGKSSLSAFLMGDPRYDYISGEILIDGKDLLSLKPDDRSKLGLFLAFQNVPEIKGINMGEYLRIIYNIHNSSNSSLMVKKSSGLSPFLFRKFIKKHLLELNIDEKVLDRDLNVGFSGGEKRKIEILQMKLIGPKYIILDEIDSGLDLDSFRTISLLLKELSNENNTIILITHYFKILDYINIDKVYLLENGKLIRDGDVNLAYEISKNGFMNFK